MNIAQKVFDCDDTKKYIFSFLGLKCRFCKNKFSNGYYCPEKYHTCNKCASYLMYERGSFGFFENKILIDN